MANALLGNGATLTFGTSGFSAKIKSLNPSFTRASEQVTALDSSAHEYVHSSLVDFSLSGEFYHDPSKTPPIDGDEETITLTFPEITSGGTTPGKYTFTGALVEYSPSIEVDGVITASFRIMPSGAVSVTAEA